MRKILYFIGLTAVLFSCDSQKVVSKQSNSPVPKLISSTVPPPKPEIKHKMEGEYFTVNISDPAKSDNTISYGSIVSAKPKGYKITKNFFPAVGQNFRIRYIILHYTALDHDKSVNVLTQQSVSSHYLVNELDDKEIYQLVDENKRAYHAGVSSWRNDKMLNDTSLGIEIVNQGYVVENNQKVFFPYPEYQYKKIALLVKDLVERYQIPATNVLGHSDVAPTRKQDPGPLFPWKRLYDEYGIGMWYDEAVKKFYFDQLLMEDFAGQLLQSPFVFKVQTVLKNFGYGIEQTGSWDDQTKKTIEAFQYHFRPSNYDGVLDAETWAILQALNQKYVK